MRIAAIIVGIDGWHEYTLPLVESIREHEPSCTMTVIDNMSRKPYPPRSVPWTAEEMEKRVPAWVFRPYPEPATHLSYSAAINMCKDRSDLWAAKHDWYIVLSNDVLCTGPFAHILEQYGDGDLVGPCLKHVDIEQVGRVPYLEGWTVAVPGRIWDTIGGWDEGMQISSYEDVEYSHRARVNGFGLIEDPALPFVHLDQKQRFYLVPNYWDSEYHNRARFIEKYGQRVTA